MHRKFLEDMNLDKETIDKVMAENGKDIEAQKLLTTAKETEVGTLQTQIADRDKDIAELKKVDAEGLQTQLTTLQTKYDTETKALAAKLAQQAKDTKIDFALTTAKAKNIKAVRALLDSEKISLDGDNLLGLTDQLAAITKDNPYLFGDATQNPPPPGNGGTPGGDKPKTLQEAVSANIAAQKG